MIFERAEEVRERTALVTAEQSWSYAELLDASAAVACRLLAGREDLEEARVGVLVSPGFDYVAAQWGVWRAGGVFVPLGLSHPPAELNYVLQDTAAEAVLVEPALRDRLVEAAADGVSPRILDVEAAVGGKDSARAAGPAGADPLPELGPSRRAMILYTSGTTSRPKGVVTTHANIEAQVCSLVEAWGWTADDHILHVLPLHHIHGIINVLTCALWSGAKCEFLTPFDATKVLDRFARGDLSLFMAVPTIYSKLLAAYAQLDEPGRRAVTAGCRQMRLMVSGSAALPVSTLEAWEKISGHTLLERYGMTEIGMALSNPLEGRRVPGHVGRPLPHVEVRRTAEDGSVLEDETVAGEIEVRGPTVFLEYWQRPDVTLASFRDGWFRTGDVATAEAGVFRILGRTSVDIIKTGGYKVSALEIEEVLRTHDEIAECAVVGVPDEEWGECVAACIVPTDADRSIDVATLRAWGKERLASYKVPTRLLCVTELPRNAMGKVQKPAIRNLFAE